MLGSGTGTGASAGSGVARGRNLHRRCSREVEEVAHEAGTKQRGEGPCQRRVPEAGRDNEEHVWHIHGVVPGAQEFDGGDGEGVAVSQNLLA